MLRFGNLDFSTDCESRKKKNGEYGFNLQALGNIGSIGDWRPIYKFTSMSFWTSSDYEVPYDQWVDTPFFVDDDMIINKGLKHSGYHVRCIRSECSLKQ